MTTKYLDSNGLLYLWQKIRTTFVSDVTWDSTNKKLIKKKKTGTNGAEESTDLVTFATVATSGSYNDLSSKPTIPTLKNVFGKVKVGSTTIEADTTQDTLELEAGSNVTLTPDATNDKVTIAATDTTYSDFTGATTSAAGTHGLVPAPPMQTTSAKIHQNVLTGIGSWESLGIGKTTDTTSTPDKFKVSLTAGATTISELDLGMASTTTPGMMSHQDKTKLDGIATGAEVNVQSDWNQATNTADDYIKNKPTLGTASAKDTVSSISSDSDNVPTVTAVKNYVASSATGAVAFQGTAPTTFAPTNYKAGYYWVVGTAGTYCGETCEAGDMIFATADYSSAYSASDFDVIQTNLDITSISNAEIDTIVAA